MQSLSDIKGGMRNDRLNGAVTTESYDEYYNRLQEMDPDNAVEPLPHSPCVKVKKTGVIWQWNEEFASRPDLCECCNEDGTPWVGNTPPAPKAEPVINTKLEEMRVNNDHATAVGLASEQLGVDRSYSVDYSQSGSSRGSFKIPEQPESVEVNSVIDAIFNNNVK